MHQPTTVARQLRTLLEEGAIGGLGDGEFLERFAARWRNVVPGNFYGQTDVLFSIALPKP